MHIDKISHKIIFMFHWKIGFTIFELNSEDGKTSKSCTKVVVIRLSNWS